MIIGIDETGVFNLTTDKVCLFTAIHLLDDSQKLQLHNDLESWKSKFKSFKNHYREIKGSSLDEVMALDFINNVIEKQKSFYITTVGTVPSDHKKIDIQHRRDSNIKDLESGVRECISIGNDSLAKQYRSLINWYKPLSYQILLKIWVLSEMIGYSYREHMIQVVLDKKDLSLGEFEISIDKDFIKKDTHLDYWRDLLRSWFYGYTYRHPIIGISEWPEDHPYYQKTKMETMLQDDGRMISIDRGNYFRDGVNFVDSHNSSIVQVADIVASIISQQLNDNKFNSAYIALQKYFIPIRTDKPIKIVKMAGPSEDKVENIPNPWKII